MEPRLLGTYLTTKPPAVTPQSCFMRGAVKKPNLSKVIYIGLFTIANFKVNKAKQRNLSPNSESRLGKQRAKPSCAREAFFPSLERLKYSCELFCSQQHMKTLNCEILLFLLCPAPSYKPRKKASLTKYQLFYPEPFFIFMNNCFPICYVLVIRISWVGLKKGGWFSLEIHSLRQKKCLSPHALNQSFPKSIPGCRLRRMPSFTSLAGLTLRCQEKAGVTMKMSASCCSTSVSTKMGKQSLLFIVYCYSQTQHWSQHQWPCSCLAFQPNIGAAAQTKAETSSSLLGWDCTHPERAAPWLGLGFCVIFLLKKKPWHVYQVCTFLSFQGKAYYQWFCISLLKI